MTRAIGYARVSTKEQEDSGAGLNAQREAIEREIERRGWAWSDNLAAPKTFVDKIGRASCRERVSSPV